jgi:hypothetical protein
MDDTLAKDFMAMWHSELTAIAADREVWESWTALMVLWSNAATAALAYQRDSAPGSAVATQPTRPAAAAAASEPGLDEIGRLNRRVAELEQQLAGLVAGKRPKKAADGV